MSAITVTLGRTDIGQPLRLRLTGGHTIAGGATGSGKSSVVNIVMADVIDRTDVAVVGIDRKHVELSPWASRLADLAVEIDQVAETTARLRSIMSHRYRLMARLGWREWPTSERHPFVLVIVDELAEVLQVPRADREVGQDIAGDIDSIGRLGRAAGVGLLLATQEPLAHVVGRVRNQCIRRVCLRVASAETVPVILGHGLAAQAPAHLLRADEPGVGYVLTEDHPVPALARIAYVDDRLRDDLANHAGRFRWPTLAELEANDAVALCRAEQIPAQS